jgi:peptidyl-prolyl cis-trans isomerase B (cyclophilin B)
MSTAISLISILFSVITPQKMWFAPDQPLTIKSDKDVTLELIDFSGKVITPKGSADIAASQSADLKNVFTETASVGTYVLYALPKGGTPSQSGPPKDFLGTPMVIEVLPQEQQPTAAGAVHVEPLQYIVMTTDAGPMTEAFYYDTAPHTVDNFIGLASGGYFTGTVFHRVVPGFVIQGGSLLGTDPNKDLRSTGSPGYTINDEFSNRPHLEGVLSMAHSGAPNSGGSQFFVCLDYTNTQQLDNKYSVFGKVVDGMDTVKSIGGAKVEGELPEHAVAVTKVEVFPVTAQKDPYTSILTAAK